jgi:hypothetical protein
MERDVKPDNCPLQAVPCPGGAEAARECTVRYNSDFDPVANFHDFGMLQCAAARAEELLRSQ